MESEKIGMGSFSQPIKMWISIMTLIGLVVPCVFGFVNFDKRLDITADTQKKHIESDEKKWEKNCSMLDTIKEDVHGLQMVDIKLEMKYEEILRRFDDQSDDFDELKGMMRAVSISTDGK